MREKRVGEKGKRKWDREKEKKIGRREETRREEVRRHVRLSIMVLSAPSLLFSFVLSGNGKRIN